MFIRLNNGVFAEISNASVAPTPGNWIPATGARPSFDRATSKLSDPVVTLAEDGQSATLAWTVVALSDNDVASRNASNRALRQAAYRKTTDVMQMKMAQGELGTDGETITQDKINTAKASIRAQFPVSA